MAEHLAQRTKQGTNKECRRVKRRGAGKNDNRKQWRLLDAGDIICSGRWGSIYVLARDLARDLKCGGASF